MNRSMFKLIKNFLRYVFSRKNENQKEKEIPSEIFYLQFDHEDDGCWYIHLPEWIGSHHNLMMVAGADELCAILSNDDKTIKVEVISRYKKDEYYNNSNYIRLERIDSSLDGGATYHVNNLEGFDRDIWLCQVTLFVLGGFPRFIYLKKKD